MLVDLFEFQQKALDELRKRQVKAQRRYIQDGDKHIIPFTAPTGAGKTIIMSAFIEALYCGDTHQGAQNDAIVLWISDSPELNEQSKMKLYAKADKLTMRPVVTIDEKSFKADKLQLGTIYFVNTQKFGENSNLVKYSNDRNYTGWDFMRNTVEEYGEKLVVIIDEAHRGAKSDQQEQMTIMQKFILGSVADNMPSMPLVIGMSATLERFYTLANASDSTQMSKVEVTPNAVRESGLLKDKINIHHPKTDEIIAEMTYLAQAAKDWKDKCKHWEAYKQHEDVDVCPVLVVQVKNGRNEVVSETDLDECLKAVEEELGRVLYEGEVAHSFGEPKTDLTINGLKVPYVEPSRIDESKKVRVVFFKESLTTGWDCPRAETMMSFRTANDYTYIAQLMGRMVRTPLHRRIDGDESLNNVHLFLPNYNSENVQKVIDALGSNDGEGIPTKIKKHAVGASEEQELHVAEDKKDVFEWLNSIQLTTYVISKYRVSNYLTSLFNLAYRAATSQGVDPEAAIRVSGQIATMIRSYIEKLQADGIYNNKVEEIKKFVLTESKMEYLKDGKLESSSEFVLELTDYDIEREFARADAKLKNAGKRYTRDYFDEADMTDLMIDVILFTQSEDCMSELDKYAKATFYQYKHEYRKVLSKYSENVKSKYDKCTREGEEVSDHSWMLPSTIYLPKGEENIEGHLFVDDEGKASFSLNSWEQQIIKDAKKDEDFVCWLRNQDRKSWSLCITYEMGGKSHPFYPDFVVVRKDKNGGYLLDLVEPHWKDEDNVPKAKAMAKYVEDEQGNVERFEMTRVYDDKMLRLDFANPAISHRLADATKYNDDFLDELFREFG